MGLHSLEALRAAQDTCSVFPLGPLKGLFTPPPPYANVEPTTSTFSLPTLRKWPPFLLGRGVKQECLRFPAPHSKLLFLCTLFPPSRPAWDSIRSRLPRHGLLSVTSPSCPQTVLPSSPLECAKTTISGKASCFQPTICSNYHSLPRSQASRDVSAIFSPLC